MTSQRSVLLLTPGPLTTSASTKSAMLRDWGSRDPDFIALTAAIRRRLVDIAGVTRTHVAVPLQGSGTFAIEATLGTLTPPAARVLVLANGAYGRRMTLILQRIGRQPVMVESAEDTPDDIDALADTLAGNPTISHVAAVHCETTSGILNPMDAIAAITRQHGRRLIIDAMSSFGALPIDSADGEAFDALVASSNKCLEGVPGLAFAIVREDALSACAGHAPSLALDLHDQWRGFERDGQWRFTPPTHVVAAFAAALDEHAAEGGVIGRGLRYRENCRVLVREMRSLGFETFLPDALQAPIIVTFRMPADERFEFGEFYTRLSERGFVIYPGKLTEVESFRVGCIGRLAASDMVAAGEAIAAVCAEMGVITLAPASDG
jgi:2-aminoethylphosphonate-pyruvate transaminase